MHRVKRTERLWKNVALLAWAVGLAFVLSLILFGAMIGAAYVDDEFFSRTEAKNTELTGDVCWVYRGPIA